MPSNLSLPISSIPTPLINNENQERQTHCVTAESLLDHSNPTGIPPEHINALIHLAESENIVFGFRPIDRLNAQLIREQYPSKGIHVKGKSSDWGPMAGFICTNQGLSKLIHSAKPDEIKHYQQKVQSCINEGHAEPGPLIISRSRLLTLIAENTHHKMSMHGENIYIETMANGFKQHYQFKAKPLQNDQYKIEYNDSPLLVLCDPESKLPLISDYDLILVAKDLAHFDNQDIPIQPIISFPDYKTKLLKYKGVWEKLFHPTRFMALSETELLSNGMSLEAFTHGLNPTMGNLSKRTEHLIQSINKVIGCRPGKELVHHGDDANNPFTSPEEAVLGNYPATIFLPYKLSLQGDKESVGRCQIVHNTEEFKALLQEIKDQGYQANPNPLWEKDLQQVRRSSFTSSKSVFLRG